MASQGNIPATGRYVYIVYCIIIISFLCQMWNEFFDDMLNPKGEEKSCLPSLLKWREKFMRLFHQVGNLLFLILGQYSYVHISF